MTVHPRLRAERRPTHKEAPQPPLIREFLPATRNFAATARDLDSTIEHGPASRGRPTCHPLHQFSHRSSRSCSEICCPSGDWGGQLHGTWRSALVNAILPAGVTQHSKRSVVPTCPSSPVSTTSVWSTVPHVGKWKPRAGSRGPWCGARWVKASRQHCQRKATASRCSRRATPRHLHQPLTGVTTTL